MGLLHLVRTDLLDISSCLRCGQYRIPIAFHILRTAQISNIVISEHALWPEPLLLKNGVHSWTTPHSFFHAVPIAYWLGPLPA